MSREEERDKLLNGRTVVTRGCHENWIGDDRKQIAKNFLRFFSYFLSFIISWKLLRKKTFEHSWNQPERWKISLKLFGEHNWKWLKKKFVYFVPKGSMTSKTSANFGHGMIQKKRKWIFLVSPNVRISRHDE